MQKLMREQSENLLWQQIVNFRAWFSNQSLNGNDEMLLRHRVC
jgi:hypothetical protein